MSKTYSSTTSQGPEQIAVDVLGCGDEPSIRSHNLHCENLEGSLATKRCKRQGPCFGLPGPQPFRRDWKVESDHHLRHLHQQHRQSKWKRQSE